MLQHVSTLVPLGFTAGGQDTVAKNHAFSLWNVAQKNGAKQQSVHYKLLKAQDARLVYGMIQLAFLQI